MKNSTTKPADITHPVVTLDTSLGVISMELYADVVPNTVNNFLSYSHAGLYEGTIFHRVIAKFVIQAGGYLRTSSGYTAVPTADPIALESNAGLSNLRGTVAMARTSVPDSATSQFYINVVDNAAGLDYKNAAEPGYAVFGKVISGLNVVDKIRNVKVSNTIPVTDVIVTSARSTQFFNGKRADFSITLNTDDSFSVTALAGQSAPQSLKFIDRIEFTDRSVSLGSAYAGIHDTQDLILLAKVSGSSLVGRAGNDWLIGKEGADTLSGSSGNDTLDGGAGVDMLEGGKGNDLYIIDAPDDVIRESPGGGIDTVRIAATAISGFTEYSLPAHFEHLVLSEDDRLTGFRTLSGNSQANSITGNSADNLIDGKGGKDTLTGGGGSDTFFLSVMPVAAKHVLSITDFNPAQDHIALSVAAYPAFAGSTMISPARFIASTKPVARSPNENLLYDTDSGKLFVDADGSGKKAPMLVATLTGLPELSASDFVIIG